MLSIRIGRIGADVVSERVPYLYSILRLVPSIERGEAINIGLVMFCRPQRFLRVDYLLDSRRIGAFTQNMDLNLIESRLNTLSLIAAGHSDGGPVAALDIGERFHWLSNVSNTMIQPGEVHPGLTADADATFTQLMNRLVATGQAAP